MATNFTDLGNKSPFKNKQEELESAMKMAEMAEALRIKVESICNRIRSEKNENQ